MQVPLFCELLAAVLADQFLRNRTEYVYRDVTSISIKVFHF